MINCFVPLVAVASIVIVIPYMVLLELETLKKVKGLRFKANKAFQYISMAVKKHKDMFRGQGSLEHLNDKIPINDNDDKMLSCCLQVPSNVRKTIFVTNDKGAKCRAILKDIESVQLLKIGDFSTFIFPFLTD